MTNRTFHDWNHPLLPQAAATLLRERFRGEGDGECDLSGVLCVLPGRRAGRLLLSLLLQQAARRGVALVPPRTATPGDLPRLLLRRDQAFATAVECEEAWLATLRRTPADTLAKLLPHPPPAGDARAWRAIAAMLGQLHELLAGSMRRFADVADFIEANALTGADPSRWRALATVQANYQATLQDCRLVDPQLGAMQAIPESALNHEKPTIVLIGVTELNVQQRQLLELVSGRVSAFVHAPPTEADAFDEFGCVSVAAWSDRRIDVPEHVLHVEDRPADQAQRVLATLASFDGNHAPHEITIGLGDANLGPLLERRGEWAGVRCHAADGQPLRHSPPFVLLAALAEWLADERFATLAAMLRHGDVERFVAAHVVQAARATSDDALHGLSDWLTLLDDYFNEHLHERFTGSWLGEERMQRRLRAVHDAVHVLVRPLRQDSRPLRRWSEPILQALAGVYRRGEKRQRDPTLRESLRALADQLDEQQRCDIGPDIDIDAATAIRITLARLNQATIPLPARPDELEMLGWLELHLDPAPAIIITGFNEGCIPESITGDRFLPNSLRCALGLSSNESRYARDAYLLTAILNSRDRCCIIAGRRSRDGDALSPSRLLLACDDATLVRRIGLMCRERPAQDDAVAFGMPPPAPRSRFTVPALGGDLVVPERMNVTWFRAYLECPYQFALAHVLRLNDVRDNVAELSGATFGTLAHDVLCLFGRDASVKDSDDAAKIESFLLDALRSIATDRFGPAPLPAVRLQLARLDQRLAAFAIVQARHRRAGWTIRECEWRFSAGAALDLPDQPHMPIGGQIDRIDYNEQSDQTLILDYKTADAGDSPHQAHHGRERISDDWTDLQLPLYRHIAQRHGNGIVRGAVQLGFVVLPKKAADVAIHLAAWSDDDIERAIDLARQVVRDIRDRKFEPSSRTRKRYDAFSRICQSSVLIADSKDDDDGDEGGGGNA